MTKTLLTALVLCFAPALAMAEGCDWGTPKQTNAATCAEGQIFDPATQSCTDSIAS